MFCYKCGFKLPDDAVFCMKCGTKLVMNLAGEISQETQTAVPSADNSGDSGELDKEALKIYMQDLLSLECANFKYQKDIKSMEDAASNGNQKVYFDKSYEMERPDNWINPKKKYVFTFRFDGQRIYVKSFKLSDLFYPEIFTDGKENRKHFWCDLTNQYHYNWVTKNAWSHNDYWPEAFLSGGRKEALAAGPAVFMKYYQTFIRECQPGYKKLFEKINRGIVLKEKHEAEIRSESKRVEGLLAEAYDLNIIPAQFRNIYAIYYLTDFITTSNESLSTAMLHCDLNQIKTSMSEIIKNQSDIIIQNSLQIAQNNSMIDQNQKTLEKLANVEASSKATAYHSAKAAKYSRMAANHTKAMALFQVANYLKG